MKRTLFIVLGVIVCSLSAEAWGQQEAQASTMPTSVAVLKAHRAVNEVGDSLQQLVTCHRQLVEAAQTLETLYDKVTLAAAGVSRMAKQAGQGGSTGQDELLRSILQMERTVQALNAQLASLDQKMTREDQRFAAISNIMANKVATTKNAIDNIR